MDEICIDIAIRQIKCQNGISSTLDNVYTNVKEDSTLLLSFGYTLTILKKTSNYVQILISNNTYLNPIKFNIPLNTYKTFDLPLYNGTFIVKIGVQQKECECPTLLR